MFISQRPKGKGSEGEEAIWEASSEGGGSAGVQVSGKSYPAMLCSVPHS